MDHWALNTRNDDRKEVNPPNSKLFIVCSRDLREEDLREPFARYGDIEDIYMPKDRNTGEFKGVAYVKYSKTSSAAAALQGLHTKSIKSGTKPIKVIVATNKTDKNDYAKDDKHNRLFIKVHQQATVAEITDYFSGFGQVESAYIQVDKSTGMSKGLAYVQFITFLDAAKAFEQCDKKYRAVFAAPKQELKRARDVLDFYNDGFHSSNSSHRNIDTLNQQRDDDNVLSLIKTNPQSNNTVVATCSPAVPQKYIEKLFNVVPGMLKFEYSMDSYNGFCKSVVTYEDSKAAAFAIERLNNYEFPSGEIICVKTDNLLSKAATQLSTIVNNFKNAIDTGSPDLGQLADAIAHASTLIKAATGMGNVEPDHDTNYCSVILPPPQKMAKPNSPVAQRCFIICRPNPPPKAVLKDVFRRFGDLIDVTAFPHKTFGFAKYASVKAAQDAIKTLDGATVCGVRLKVLEADEKPSKDDEHKMKIDSDENDHDNNVDRKRQRLLDNNGVDDTTDISMAH